MKAARNLGLVVVIAALMAVTADRVFARPCCENCDDPNACAGLCGGDPACTEECHSHAMACWGACLYCTYCGRMCPTDYCGPFPHYCDWLYGCCM
jgi:hypothetical protein